MITAEHSQYSNSSSTCFQMQHQPFQELGSSSETFERSLSSTGHGNSGDDSNVELDTDDEQHDEELINTETQQRYSNRRQRRGRGNRYASVKESSIKLTMA